MRRERESCRARQRGGDRSGEQVGGRLALLQSSGKACFPEATQPLPRPSYPGSRGRCSCHRDTYDTNQKMGWRGWWWSGCRSRVMHREGLLRGAPRGNASGQLSSQTLRLECRVRPGVCPLDEAGVWGRRRASCRSRRSSVLLNCSARRAPPAPLPRTCRVPSSAVLAAGACHEGGRGLRFPWLKPSSLRGWWLGRISAFSVESSLRKSQGTSSTRCCGLGRAERQLPSGLAVPYRELPLHLVK